MLDGAGCAVGAPISTLDTLSVYWKFAPLCLTVLGGASRALRRNLHTFAVNRGLDPLCRMVQAAQFLHAGATCTHSQSRGGFSRCA